MRKRIGIFIGEITGEFQRTITKVITKKANVLGYDVVFICSFGSNYKLNHEDLIYFEGEKACIHLPDVATLDGIIVTEDLFDIPGMDEELYKELKEKATCPVVYLRTKREDFYSILLENKASIEKMVRHFTDEHGFTDICYMSGKKGIIDTTERLDGYLSAMASRNLPVNEHMIFHGNYWRDHGDDAVDWFMEGRTTYPQAIVCANDYMAMSICEALRKRGVKVPEEVCVSGFDFVDEAKVYEPTLTSLEVDFEAMSETAVDIIDRVNNGEAVDRTIYVEATLKLNKSCGCGTQYSVENGAELIEKNYRLVEGTKGIMLSTLEYQDAFEFDEYMAVANKYKECIHSPKAMFCLNDINEQGVGAVENDSSFTNQMVLLRIFEEKKNQLKLEEKFPRSELLPKQYWSEEQPNNYLFFCLHFKNIVFGYMVTTIPENDWFDISTQAYLMSLANAIENGNVHRRMERLEEIRDMYQKDSLTGLYNRRGFDKLLRQRFTESRDVGENIGIASIDMDNLKVINDNFGHAEGDKALQVIANALQSVLQEGEFCARVGGDEFAAVINIPNSKRGELFIKELDAALETAGASLSLYEVKASVGISESMEEPDSSLHSCIQKADMRMYENKRARKEVR